MSPVAWTSAAVGIAATVVATTFELLPERVDLLGFVLQGAGFFALIGTAVSLGTERRRRRGRGRELPRYTEYFTVLGAALGLVVFLILLLIQEVS